MHHVHVENITNQQVGERIAKVRGQIMKMTQAELAAEMSIRLGRQIRPLTVTRLEGGKRPIGVDELVAAAEALHIKPADLLTDDGLPVGSMRIISAYQALLRASNQLNTAVRQYDSAHHHLRDVLDEKGDKFLERLPAITRMFVDSARDWTVEMVINEARSEGGEQDAAEA